MSRAEEFRQSTEQFWSEMDRKKKSGRSRSQAKGDEFRQYAEEALRWAHQSKNEKEKEALVNLARTWMQATLESESTFVANSRLLLEHDLFRKPVSTFRDHALEARAP